MNGGRTRRGDGPLKTDENNFIRHSFVQFRKQHSRTNAILSSIVLSLQCCEVYFISITVAKLVWDLTIQDSWNCPPNRTVWIHPW